MRSRDWEDLRESLMQNATTHIMPKEIRKEGRFETLLKQFLDEQGAAMVIEEINMGKAFFEEGKAFFKMEALQTFLDKKRFKDFSTTQMTATIRQLNGGEARLPVDGTTTFMWWVPHTPKEEKSFAIPNLEEEKSEF